jgi:hypothetical protein
MVPDCLDKEGPQHTRGRDKNSSSDINSRHTVSVECGPYCLPDPAASSVTNAQSRQELPTHSRPVDVSDNSYCMGQRSCIQLRYQTITPMSQQRCFALPHCKNSPKPISLTLAAALS